MLKEATINALNSLVDNYNEAIAPELKEKVKYVVMEYDPAYFETVIAKAEPESTREFKMAARQLRIMSKRLDFTIVPVIIDGIATIHVIVTHEPKDIEETIERMKIGLNVIVPRFLKEHEIG